MITDEPKKNGPNTWAFNQRTIPTSATFWNLVRPYCSSLFFHLNLTKMKIQKFVSLFLFIAFLMSTSVLFAQNSENRKVTDFESISLSIHAKVYLTQGKLNSVTLKGNADDLKEIITEVENGTLQIKRKKNKNWIWNSSLSKLEIYVTSASIKNLKVSGSGTIITKNPVTTDQANYIVSGSGSIFIEDLAAEAIDCLLSGSGNIQLKGDNLQELTIKISGSGDVDASDLIAENVGIHLSGSGNCRVHVKQKLSGKLSGSGDIYYRGKPESVDTKVSGSGHIKSVGW